MENVDDPRLYGKNVESGDGDVGKDFPLYGKTGSGLHARHSGTVR